MLHRLAACCLGAALAAQAPAPAPSPAPASAAPAPTSAPAPAPAEKPAIRHDATTMILAPGCHELCDLVDATARFLQRNILLGDLRRQGRPAFVTLQSSLRVDRESCEEAIGQLLHEQRFVLVPRDEANGIQEVVALDGQRIREVLATPPVRTVEEILRRPALPQPVSTTVPLGTTPAAVAVNGLRPFLARGDNSLLTLSIAPAAGNALVISGLQCDVARLIGLLYQANREAERAANAAAATTTEAADAGDADAAESTAASDGATTSARLTALERTLRQLEERITALEKAAARR